MNKVVINICYGGYGLSGEAQTWLRERGREDLCDYDAPRHDPTLIECVETLGDRASGYCADLAVVEIKGSRYRIEEYDGLEHVITPFDEVGWIDIEEK